MCVGWAGEIQLPLLLFCPPAIATSWPSPCVPWTSTEPGISHKVRLSAQGKSVVLVLVFGLADDLLCNPTGRMKRGKLWEVNSWPGAMELFLWNDNFQITKAAPRCFFLAQVTGLSHSLYDPLLQERLLNLFDAPCWRECWPQPDSSFSWAVPCCEIWAVGLHLWLLWILLLSWLPGSLPLSHL